MRWERLLDNLPLKLLALLMAFLLWLNVNTANPVQKDVEVPIEFVNLPPDAALYFESGRPRVDRVQVRLRGPKNQVEAIGTADVFVRVDLSKAPVGSEVYIDFLRDTRVEIGAPFAVAAQSVNPPSMTLQLDRKLRRSVRVIPSFNGSPPPGYDQQGFTVEPPVVQIEGPESLAQNIHLITTETIDLRGQTQDLERQVRLIVNPQLTVLHANHVNVRVRVRENEEERTLTGVVVQSEPAGAAVQPERVSVVLSGPASLVEAASAQQLRAVVPRGDQSAGRWLRLEPRIEFTESRLHQLKVIRIEPDTIRARW
ncbi:MAG TPA: CdaR family protein [Acidobacteriota bacterium]